MTDIHTVWMHYVRDDGHVAQMASVLDEPLVANAVKAASTFRKRSLAAKKGWASRRAMKAGR